MINELNGLAIKESGMQGLCGLRSRLNAPQCRELSASLQAIDTRAEPTATVIAREHAWYRAQASWREKALLTLAPTAVQKLRQPVEESAQQAEDRVRTRPGLLVTDLAIRCFRLENSRLPRDLDELVPGVLTTIPQDPYSGRPLRYHVEGDEYVLYSVGPDRKDDGGRPFPDRSDHTKAKGDYLVDPLFTDGEKSAGETSPALSEPGPQEPGAGPPR
jgi:hypothetical protein